MDMMKLYKVDYFVILLLTLILLGGCQNMENEFNPSENDLYCRSFIEKKGHEDLFEWLGKDDPSAVVWDEIVGYLITMIAAPAGWQWLVLGFVLFRFFDILKPWPINLADKAIHGGLGIMVDDVIAGIFALVCVQWIYHVFPTISW